MQSEHGSQRQIPPHATVDVKMTGVNETAAISTKDLNGKVVRASLALHVLSARDLWNMTNAGSPIDTTDLSVPVSFVRRQGKSDAAKIIQGLISFSQTATARVPPNPYVKGTVGELANSLITTLQRELRGMPLGGMNQTFNR
jgi:hypothetical protein